MLNRLKFILIFFTLLTSCSKQKIKLCNNSKDKSFVVVIPSYNNEKWYKHNLDSVFKQNYKKFRVIYIDDNSTDNTYNLVKHYIDKNKKTKQIILIKNKQNVGALANHYNALNLCDDNEIIVSLDGDDWFADEYVLQYLNDVYKDENIWLTYGQFQNWPTNKIGWCKPIPTGIIDSNKFREFGFCMAQPRTYYAWLAKKIKKEDLLDQNNQFYKVAGDVALMFPMIEMAGNRFKYIDKVLCIRNVQTTLNDFKLNKFIQKNITQLIRKKKKYKRSECY